MSVAKIKKCLGELERQPNSKQWIQSLGDVAWVRMKSSLIADMRAENLAGRGDMNGALGLIDRYSTNVKDDLKALHDALTPKPESKAKPKPEKKSAIPPLFQGSKHAATYNRIKDSLNDMVPAFGDLFKGVELYEDSDQRTGGFAFNNKTGKLMVILADINAALKDVKDVEKWVGTALVEEAIHSSTRRLEKQGKFNGKELLRAIRRDAKHVYDKIREAYKTGSDEAAADEFIRMIVQGRVRFNVGKNNIVIDGELTEMQYTPTALGALKKVLEQLLGIIRNLKQKLPAHLADRLEEIRLMIEEDIRSTTEKPQETRPADEEFVWTAEDNMSGTQPISDPETEWENTHATPYVLYHGSEYGPGKFRGNGLGVHFGPLDAAEERLKQTGNRNGVARPYHVDIKNPVLLRYDPDLWSPHDVWKSLPLEVRSKVEENYPYDIRDDLEPEELKKELQNLGFDGIEYPNAFEGGVENSFVAFDESQISSADIRYSQPIAGRSQELGVKNLGEERPVESIKLIEQAVKDTIFDADTKRLDDPDDYQEARDLAISLTTGKAGDVLRGLKDRIADLPELADVPKNLDALSALVYKQLVRYAVRLITDGTGGRNADFSLFKTLLDNYGNLPLAAMEDAVNYDDGTAKATTRLSRIMRSLREATEPMGLFFKYYGERQVDAKKAMLEQGMSEDQIQALSDFINNIKPDEDFKKDVGDELESKKDELNRLQAKIDALMKQLNSIPNEGGSLTPEELAMLPKDIREAYLMSLRGRMGGVLKEEMLKSLEQPLFNAREMMEESGIQALADAFFVGGKKKDGKGMLSQKTEAVNSQMRAIIQETLKKMGIVSAKTAADPNKVYEQIAIALGSDELRLKKVPLIEEAIQKRIVEETKSKTFQDAMKTEWGREMWAQWSNIADELNATTKVSGGILQRAIRNEVKAAKKKLSELTSEPDRDAIIDSVLGKIKEVSGRSASNIQEGMWDKVREEIKLRLNGMVAQSIESKSRKQKTAKEPLPFDIDAMISEEAKKIRTKLATNDTPDNSGKEADVNLTLRRLAKMHLDEAQRDFMEIATNMGLSQDDAAELERAISSARMARQSVAAYRKSLRNNKSEEQKIADETRRLMAKYATPDTWTNESPKAKSDLENLVNQHLRAPVVNFVEQATGLGVPEEQAILLEKQVTSARDARAIAAEYRRNNPSEKAKQAAIDAIMKKVGPSVKPEGKKPRVVDAIMEAMMEHPEQINDPAWRKGVIEGWLEAQGIDPADFPVGKMDALIAGMFANAQGKALQRFYGKRDADGKLIKRQKTQPTELQKITNAIKVGMITGAPVEWQTAFTEKTGMKPLTPDEMRDVLRYSEIVNNADGEFLRQDQVHALGKLSTIFRRAGARPSFLSYLAASYTTSALTGLATQSMQVHAAASNWMARIYEDLATGQGVMPVMNAIRLAVDSYKRTFASAWVNDSYREQQLDEVAKLSALKTLLEDKIAKFQSSKGAARIAQIPGILVGLQDFFRRFMSSADDAAVAGLKAYIQSVEGQSILRGSGIDQKTINGLFDVAREEMETLSNEESRVANRPQFNEKEYRAWVVDKVTSNLRKSMSELLMAKGKSESDVKQMLADLDSYSEHEAEADVGVGKLRDSGSRLDPIQKAGEWIVSGVEKALRLNPKDTDPDAALKYIGARMLFGFVRTQFSVMSRAVYRGPLGLWRLAITGAILPGKTSERASKMYARTMGTARQQAQRRKEALVWTLTMTALHLLARGLSKDDEENDPIVINGQGPEDPEAKAAWKAAGHVANSIELNIGGEKISIPFGRSGLENIKPALMMLGTLDDMHQNGMPKGTPENLWTYAKSYGANTIYTANLFGFRNIANWRQDTSSENALVKRALYSFSPLIPFSGMVKSIGKTIRPDKPDDKTFKGAIALSTPVFWIGEDAYNMYGDKVYGTPSSTHGDVTNRLMYAIGLPFSIDSQKDEEAMKAYQFSLKTGLAPSSPDRTDVDRRLKRENKITEPLSDEQWVRYQKAAGKTRMEAMKEFAPRAEGMSTEAINRNLNVVDRRAERAGEAAIR